MAQHAFPFYAFDRHFPVRVRLASRLSDGALFELCAVPRISEMRA